MAEFLKPERKKQLIEALMEIGCDPDRAGRVATIQEDQFDHNMFAHAEICLENVAQNTEKEQTFYLLSAACIGAITDEAVERGFSDADFRISQHVMQRFVAIKEEEDIKEAKQHNRLN
jgi:hypothetical protein